MATVVLHPPMIAYLRVVSHSIQTAYCSAKVRLSSVWPILGMLTEHMNRL